MTGSCGNALTAGISVATYPNPASVGNPYGCGDDLLLVNSSNANQAAKPNGVQDYCPVCNSQFNGANGHIDNYSANQACSGGAVGDLGNFWTADTH